MTHLNSLGTGEVGVVQDLNGGRGFVSRAAALGFTPGTEVVMLQNFRRGPLIVVVRDTHVALGCGEARKIKVRKLAD
ncbi:MAG: ferrous iron transport protein A [Anaerolineaceae bacterium]|nr:ferrous iron transport protein A [Anaerolineaceae bacterium]